MHNDVGTLYVMPLGFKIEYQIRFLMHRGLGRNDGVVVLLPIKRDTIDKPDKALNDLKEYLKNIGIKDFITVKVSTNDPTTLLINPFNEIVSHAMNYDKVVIAVTGGVRTFAVSAPLLAIMLRGLLKDKEVSVFTVSEDLDDYVEFTEIIRPFNVALELGETDIGVLRAIETLGANATIATISESVDKDTSTVNRSVLKLKDYGLIREIGTRPRRYEITEVGRFMIKYYETLQSLRKKQ